MHLPSWLCLALAFFATVSLHAQTLRFTDISAAAGIRGIVEHGGHAIVFADVNADGFADMYVTHTNFVPGSNTEFLVLPDELFINNGDNTFTNAATSAGVDDPGQSHGAVFIDIDNDGDFDLFNGQRGPHGNRLYRNAGNAIFNESTSSAGILASDRRTIGALGLDIENDGDVDLFAANWGLGNELYVNNGSGVFTNQTHRGVFDREPDNAGTMAATAADVDNDGDLDIFLAKRDDTCRLYINNGNGFFVDEANARGTAFNGSANGGVFFDMDRDADLDLLLATSSNNGSRNGELTVLRVYRNNGAGFFTDETDSHNIPFEGYTVNVGDLDNDGDEDIFLSINFGASSVWLNNGAGNFTKQNGTGLERNGVDARATSFSDIDNDGDLDAALTYIEEPNFLFRNELNTNRDAKNYLQISATSPSGETGAWGAKFYLYEAGHLDEAAFLRGYRQLTSVQGTLSGNGPIAHFGVDPSLTYDVRVRFLGGATTVLTNLAPGQRLHVNGGDNAPPAISNVAATSLVPTSATITWNTDEPATSQVEYGATPALGAFTIADQTLKQTHRVVLNNLLAGTTYYYRARSGDAANQASASDTLSFTTTQRDSTPPLISGITTLEIQASAVRIVWSTDELATSQVEYGLTPSYGSFSPQDSALTLAHEARLSGLNGNTTYHFRVISQDAQGNRAISNDAQFTTLAGPLLADDFNAASLDLTKWNKGSHSGNTSALVSGALVLRTTTPSTSGWIHTRDKFTGANKSAQIKIVQANDDGALGLSPTVTTSALNGIYDEPSWYRFYNYRASPSGPYQLFVQWNRNGVVNGLDVAASVAFFAPFYLRLRTDTTNIYFEYSFDNSAWQTAYSETFNLPGHSLHEQFYFELAAFHTPVKGEWRVDDFALNTTAPIGDNTAPVITAVSASNLTSTSANIVWNTDEASDSQVEYGLTSGYGALTALDPVLVLAHNQTLTGLTPNTLYHYRVHARDASNNLRLSGDYTFVTSRVSTDSTDSTVAFDNVQGIFNRNCVRCHQGNPAPAGLVLSAGESHHNIVNVPSTEYPQWLRVHPGNRATSWLYEKISNVNPAVGSKMENLTPEEIALIGKWIDQGATRAPTPPYAALQFRTTTLPLSEINIAYNVEVVVWGGLPPYQYSLVAEALPPGMTLNASAGIISGAPTSTGIYNFTVRAGDSQSPAVTREHTYTLEVRDTQASWQVSQGFEVQAVVTDVDMGVNIAFVPNPGPNADDAYFYISSLYGEIIMVQRDFQKRVYAANLLNFDPRTTPGFEELGVDGIVVDPITGDVFATMPYEQNGLYYGKVVRFQSTDGGRTAATQNTIFSDIPIVSSHQVHAVTIGPDGKLYVNTGDGQEPNSAVDEQDPRGKILRMNFDGTRPPDNPYVDSYAFALGLRNPFGADWRTSDGQLYISDNGTGVNDRLIQVSPGGNYGWPHDLTQGAIHLWTPTVAPTAIDFLQDSGFPSSYHGQLFVAWSGQTYAQGTNTRGKKIEAFELDESGAVASHDIFLDYVGVGYATVIGLAFGPDGLYFTDLYGENGFDTAGYTHGNVYRVRWMASDSAAPVSSNVQATNVSNHAATIVWQTNEPAKRQVEYGPTAAYGNWSVYTADLQTSHSVALTGLSPQTAYHYRVWNWDAFNNGAASPDFTFTTRSDTSVLIVSNVAVSNVSTGEAQISWSTNRLADSQVEYGLSASYASLSALDTAKTLAHQITLTNLAPNTRYHYRVRSREPDGVLAMSEDFTFTTQAAPALFADDFNAATLDLAKWTRGANSGNQTAVSNNALQLQASGTQSGWVVTRQAFVARNTSAAVKIAQPNDDGDLGMSPTFNPASNSGIYAEENWYRFYVYREAPGNYRLFAQWAKGGVEDGLDVTGALMITSTIYLRLRFDESNIHFEASLDGAQWSAVYSEAFGLPGSSLADKFYYELAAARTETKGVMLADDFSIQNHAPIIDTQAPALSNIASSNLTASGAAISWNTDELSDAQVEYGLTASYGNLSPLVATMSASHRLELAGLSSDTTYHYRVRSQDASGNLATSADFTFRTLRANTSVLFADDFSGNALDAGKWNAGTNSGNRTSVSNNALQLQSVGSQSGWVVTKQAYVAKNSAVTVRVTQPSDDGDLGMSPTFDLSATTGIFTQKNWYRFYVYRDQPSGPYLLYAQWSKNGAVVGREVTGGFVITEQSGVYLRLRFDATQIYFEASLDGVNWTTAYNETFALPGHSLNDAFFYELSAYKTQNKNAQIVDDFVVTASAGAPFAEAAPEKNVVDAGFTLSQNYPNPFNLATQVRLSLPEPGRVQAVIYNLQGQEVKRLSEKIFSAGTHELLWRGVNENEEEVSSGIYLLRVVFEGASNQREVVTRRLVIMK